MISDSLTMPPARAVSSSLDSLYFRSLATYTGKYIGVLEYLGVCKLTTICLCTSPEHSGPGPRRGEASQGYAASVPTVCRTYSASRSLTHLYLETKSERALFYERVLVLYSISIAFVVRDKLLNTVNCFNSLD
jgi:hypothetical protein